MEDNIIFNINYLLNQNARYDKIYNFFYSIKNNNDIMIKKTIISSIPYHLLNNNNFNFFFNRFKDITIRLSYQKDLLKIIKSTYQLYNSD